MESGAITATYIECIMCCRLEMVLSVKQVKMLNHKLIGGIITMLSDLVHYERKRHGTSLIDGGLLCVCAERPQGACHCMMTV